ncbi:helix-turn-helix transcriptional regulator [Xanthomonas sacchari]|uniref:helix-turn-helix transcriptional regulator n=1 Tax=Xanthomonas sacchari TaxID=56458 RepID=UPI002251CFA4|nr:helix-turn-helix domain-containing protein [Xanthomonas sacchari]
MKHVADEEANSEMPEMSPVPVRLTERTAKRLTSEQLEEVRTRLANRHPDSDFNAAEAAIYTGRSTKTLKRAIDAGVGPKRAKNPDVTGRMATNRHTRYRKSDLDAWRLGLVSFATQFRTFDDLTLESPWIVQDDVVLGHLLDAKDLDAMIGILGVDAVAFFRLDEVLKLRWSDADMRSRYELKFTSVTGRTLDEFKVSAEWHELRQEIKLPSSTD